jgi:hypothetical protein
MSVGRLISSRIDGLVTIDLNGISWWIGEMGGWLGVRGDDLKIVVFGQGESIAGSLAIVDWTIGSHQ